MVLADVGYHHCTVDDDAYETCMKLGQVYIDEGIVPAVTEKPLVALSTPSRIPRVTKPRTMSKTLTHLGNQKKKFDLLLCVTAYQQPNEQDKDDCFPQRRHRTRNCDPGLQKRCPIQALIAAAKSAKFRSEASVSLQECTYPPHANLEI